MLHTLSYQERYTSTFPTPWVMYIDQRFSKRQTAYLLLVVCILLFLAQRILLVLFAPSHVAHPYFDETVSGVLACDILDQSIRAPLFAYEYLNRSGDVLTEGFLLVPYFKLFGRSVFSTKLFALSSALVTLIIWIFFLKKYQGTLSAFVFALLYALPPLAFSRMNLLGTISSHHMICPLIALQSFLLFMILFAKPPRIASLWLWLFSGLVAGFGIYCFYTYTIFISFCILFFLLAHRSSIRITSVLAFLIGTILGFAPWILRSLSSPTGGTFLKSIIKSCTIDLQAFFQNFLFAVPHSLGYSYPSRSIGLVSTIFSLVILLSTCVTIGYAFICTKKHAEKKIATLPPAVLQAVFCSIFPIFFLTCLSISPMRIAPFEYWPTVGLFATFGEPDIIRYRWLHILFPFYFATVASALSLLWANYRRYATAVLLGSIVIFSFITIVKTFALCSYSEFGKIFLYTGYNYDQFAPKFILGDFAPRNRKTIKHLVAHYPETNRSEAYRAFGSRIAVEALLSHDPAEAFAAELSEIPPQYLSDIIYGVVRLAQDIPLEKLSPLIELLKKHNPALLYRTLGYRHLGYKHYAALVNDTVLFQHIPQTEQWFYKNFLDGFRREMNVHTPAQRRAMLLHDITTLETPYQADVASGIGMLVGSEMLFDPLQKPDYPLDSTVAKILPPPLHYAFYQGIGMGFAETLCRYWRRLMPPESGQERYLKGLCTEWERCRLLLAQMPAEVQPIIQEGLQEELTQRKTLNSATHAFIAQYISPLINAPHHHQED